MTPEDWHRLQEAFETAISLESSALQAFLAKFEDEHPSLADELQRLLEEDQLSDDILIKPIAEAAAELSKDKNDPWIGRTLGSYEITSRVAVGGMGAVFQAQRIDQQFDQRVAIKIMSAQLLADDSVVRFRTERQILANLNHPNIGKLLDGGTTEGGLPYLVMEYIEGRPIDSYCDEHQLDITSRLQLFQEVCQAVDYAHRNLVVHRDLKPSNIIIDSEGKPQLLDFGIAKLLDEDAISQPVAETIEGMRAMTRSFASPEQVKGEAISVATDVYSLGVLLYQLLTGHSPYGDTVKTPKDVENAILETDPKRPSTVVTSADSNSGDTSAFEIGKNRSSTPSRLKNSLSGDLDNIVLMAMRKEPEHRYASVRQFAEDIDRYLRHEPVRAHPISLRYRAAKFVQRNKLGVLVTGTSVLIIALMTVVYTLNVTHERNRAQLEATTAERVSEFMQSLFETADPSESLGETISVRTILDAGARRIEYELAEEPALRAAMLDAMGGAYMGLGLYRESQELLDEALRLRRDLHGTEHTDVLETLVNLATLANARGEFALGEETIRQALQISRDVNGEYHETTGVCLHYLGWTMFEQGKIGEAVPWFEAGLASFGQGAPDGSVARANFLNAYGWVLLSIGEFEAAEEYMRAAS